MEDYYDYFLSRPPEREQLQREYEEQLNQQNQAIDPNTRASHVSLNTIAETEKESVATSETSQNREIQRLDSFALNPDEIQRQFLSFLKERNRDIEVIELEDRLAKDLDIDITDDEIRKVIEDLSNKNKELKENKIRNKEFFPYDVERLKYDLLEQKKQSNYDKAAIKILKINLGKKMKGKLGRTERALTKEKEKDKLLERLQAVYDDNVRLKQEIHVKDQEYKNKIGKLNALNSELTKQLNAKFPVLPEKDLSKTDSAAQAAALRLKVKSLNEQIHDLKEKVLNYENNMVKLNQNIDDRDPARFELKIHQLRTDNEKLQTENSRILVEMSLPKQLQTIFPKTDKLALKTLNFVHEVETNRFVKNTYSKAAGGLLSFAEKLFNKVCTPLENTGNKIMFLISKKVEFHPDSKKVIEATISAWNNSSIVGQHIQMQSQERKALEDRVRHLEKELGHVGNANQPFALMKEDKKNTNTNSQAYSIKELDNLKQQWENLPGFVKRYIKQLEGDVTTLKVKVDKRRKKKAKPEEEKEAVAVISSKNTQKGKPDQKQNLNETKKKDKIDPLDPRSENEKTGKTQTKNFIIKETKTKLPQSNK